MLRLLKKHWAIFLILFLLVGRVVSYAQEEAIELVNPVEQQYVQEVSSTQPNLSQTISGDLENDDGFIGAVSRELLGSMLGWKQQDLPLEERTGAIQVTNHMIATLYETPPASGMNYVADLKNNFFGLGAKTAYAQGIGFAGLQPILPVWKVFRNLVYALYAVIFLVLGIMIIFRMKISPKAVITIQNALPKAITTLLLVTFSYAIAGLLIDFSYVILFLVLKSFEFTGALSPSITDNMQRAFLKSGLDGSVADMFSAGLRLTIHGTVAGLSALIGAAIGLLFGPFALATAGIGAIAGLTIFQLLFIIMILIFLLKTFFALIKTYINIIISIILSPLQIATGAFPSGGDGMTSGFSGWFKGLVANIMVFPIVGIVIMIGRAITEVSMKNTIWKPPILFGESNILQSNGKYIDAIIAIGLFMILPKIPDIVRQAFGIKDSGIGQTIGQSMGFFTSPISGTARALSGAALPGAYERYGQPGLNTLASSTSLNRGPLKIGGLFAARNPATGSPGGGGDEMMRSWIANLQKNWTSPRPKR